MKHKKHNELARKKAFRFSKCDISFLGTHCNRINNCMIKIAEDLRDDFKLAVVDAEHKAENQLSAVFREEKKLVFNRPASNYSQDDLLDCSETDGCLINGNHYAGEFQVVFIDPGKETSLLKRREQITNVLAVICLSGSKKIPDFITNMIDTESVPVLDIADISKLTVLVKERLKRSVADVKGLILAGGESRRMGKDKSILEYNGSPQDAYLSGLFEEMDLPYFVSKGDPKQEVMADAEIIYDSFTGLGPFGGILSAFRKFPDSALLVVACDLPLLNIEHLMLLHSQRDPSKVATCFRSVNKDFPDPLLAIYEPRAYNRFLDFLSLGYSCPRKVLINSDVNIISVKEDNFLMNVNNPDEYKKVKTQIRNFRGVH